MRDDIIRMAREAGFVENQGNVFGGHQELERFYNLAVQHEREECAKVCEGLNLYGGTDMRQLQIATLKDCAVAIRHRSKIDSIVQNERSARGEKQ